MSESSAQLAAIVFTDIVGYSRLMEEDEGRTIQLLREHNGIVLPLIESHGGEIVDAIGDGLFLLFPTLRQAILCSISVQTAVAARNTECPERERFLLRIGIHLGEIVRDEGRAFGNGVNIAARIQPYARPGGICVTEDVYRHAANAVTHEFRPLGRKHLKNIRREMTLYEVTTGHETEAANDSSHAEFDRIKQRMLQEREDIFRTRRERSETKHETDLGERLGSQIESTVFSLVERVMDTAVQKWESLPDEAKQAAQAHVSGAPRARHSKSDIRIPPEPESLFKDVAGGGSSDVSFGLLAGIAFGIGYFVFSHGWMIYPFVLLGVLPVTSGIVKMLKRLHVQLKRRRERPAYIEQALLQLAGELGGTLTVVQVGSRLRIPLDEAQTTLDSMTARGYVVQTCSADGIIEYHFPSVSS